MTREKPRSYCIRGKATMTIRKSIVNIIWAASTTYSGPVRRCKGPAGILLLALM